VELQDYLAVLRRRWLTVVITAGLFMVLAGAIAASREPAYETSIDLFVVGRSADGTIDYTSGLMAEDRAQTYARLIGTRRVGEAIVEDLGLSADPGAIAAKLDGRASPDSVVVVATVRDSTPEGAQKIANSLGRVLPTLVRELERTGRSGESSIDIVPLGSAPLSTSSANASLWTLLLIGGTVGLVAGLALALVHQRFDPVVRSLDDLARVPASVIGIVHVRRGRERDVGRSGHDERFALVRLSLERLGVETTSMLITTGGPERREAARAVNSLARAFAIAGQKVKIVDVSQSIASVAVFGADDPVPHETFGLPPTGAEALLAELPKGDADVVLVYGPPLLSSVDGILIATEVSSVLLVVHGGRSRKADVVEAVRLLSSLGVPAHLLLVQSLHRWRPRRNAPTPEAGAGADDAHRPRIP